MTKPIAVRIQDETFARLKTLSKKTGRTTTFYIHEAIEEHIDDLEDIYLAEQSLENLRQGKDKVMAKEDFWNELEN
jgi:RHH-type transcriptional regulator, rel operon repressor / antitoxin RelB